MVKIGRRHHRGIRGDLVARDQGRVLIGGWLVPGPLPPRALTMPRSPPAYPVLWSGTLTRRNIFRLCGPRAGQRTWSDNVDSGNTVWAGAIGGAVHNPTAIAEPTTELQARPTGKSRSSLISAPLTALFGARILPKRRFEDRIKIVRRSRGQFGGFSISCHVTKVPTQFGKNSRTFLAATLSHHGYEFGRSKPPSVHHGEASLGGGPSSPGRPGQARRVTRSRRTAP